MNKLIGNTYCNAQVLAAIYFGLFTLVFNLIAKYFFFVFQSGNFLPLYSTSLLALSLGVVFGSLYGKNILKATSTKKIFGIGTLYALTIIPFYSLGLQIIYYFQNPSTYSHFHNWQYYFVLYGIILLFFLVIIGIWLIPLSGVAAIHFNRRFYPGCNAYLLQEHSKN